MNEITDFPTDEQVGFQTQEVGIDPVTGLNTYRRFFKMEGDAISKQGIISYHEWKVGKDGKIYQELFTMKTYYVVDIEANGQTPEDLRYTNWFGKLAPVLSGPINDVLKNQLEINCPTGIVP